MNRYSLNDLPTTKSPSIEAVANFEKLSIAKLDTREEQAIAEAILLAEIGIAVRSMGSGKDWSEGEIKMYCNQVLQGFLARKSLSFASALLFFKIRRAKLAPLTKPTYGLNPTTILDELNVFLEWQKEQVLISTQKAQKESYVGNYLPADQIALMVADMRYKLEICEKQQCEKAKETRARNIQIKRLVGVLLLQAKGDNYQQKLQNAEALCQKTLREWGAITAEQLKEKIDAIAGAMAFDKLNSPPAKVDPLQIDLRYINSDGDTHNKAERVAAWSAYKDLK